MSSKAPFLPFYQNSGSRKINDDVIYVKCVLVYKNAGLWKINDGVMCEMCAIVLEYWIEQDK